MTRLKYLDPADGQYKLLPVGGGAAPDEVWIGPTAPTDPNAELWYDQTTSLLKAHSGGSWVIVVDPASFLTQAQGDTRYVNTTGDTMTGQLTVSADPTAAMGVATKQYVDRPGQARYFERIACAADKAFADGSSWQVVFDTEQLGGWGSYGSLAWTSAGIPIPVDGIYLVTGYVGWPSGTYRGVTDLTRDTATFTSDTRSVVPSNTAYATVAGSHYFSTGNVVGMKMTAYGAAPTVTSSMYLSVTGPI